MTALLAVACLAAFALPLRAWWRANGSWQTDDHPGGVVDDGDSGW
jgi:hypothetical protein